MLLLETIALAQGIAALCEAFVNERPYTLVSTHTPPYRMFPSMRV